MGRIKDKSTWILILFFTVFYTTYSVTKHLRLETSIFDLGYYDQLLWLASKGNPMFSSVIWANPWIDHFSPSLYLLTPLYWFYSTPLTLLIFQSVFVCLGAYPIYRLALKKTNSKLFSLSIGFCYLIFYGIQNAISFDFHPVTLGAPLLAFIFWFYEEKKILLFWVMTVIFAGLQENYLIFLIAYGLFLVIRYKDIKRGLIIISASSISIVLFYFFVVPEFAGGSYYYTSILPKYTGIFDIIRQFYFPYSKLQVMAYSFVGFGLLPAFTPSIFILLAEEYLGRFLLTSNPNWWNLGFHYNAILAPIMAYGTIEGVAKYFKGREKVAIGLLAIGVVVSQLQADPEMYTIFKKESFNFSRANSYKRVLNLIPENASVAATNDLGAQISERVNIFFLANCLEDTSSYGSDGRRCYPVRPDYIVANMDPNKWNNYYPDYDRESLLRYFDFIQTNYKYTLMRKTNDLYMFRKN